MLAALAADGVTRITGVEHLERGYDDVIGSFAALGARLTLCEAEDERVHAVFVR